ncbi:DNA mismatch repair protein MutS [Streptococcus constellatus subsp. pharyngis]|uniref:DNA mismatch repair protein MutS n=1 Tax=Streptococcus constellatus subsp. pharyngis SK1060 = CCUG 46377 TaxID=1035184 RepID=U2ZHI0_STRCV|nr:DNA mismatch repair protein MutS [Streptococcus constellatus]AGU73578.1 DNA mismatch repair protein [Streptococcus constellatus subsp. pharyngis C232]AGU75332.1 DNA mismatch repair protein [Streptococcus constellatus subsp. pharyngis C818]AGU80722.1 DNA mismatch repair protein [Streptococcus constellatus subsp. pharyngis C1050]QQC22472.1 DNA mismatch repair protein MutS [Streptococcus constellatus]QRP81544.1 DNA mismatch repair protein MutS [Streptococcus constellatus]
MTKEKLSPGMQQYLDIKKDYPDAFLLFRMGDFYELFYEDAINAAQILEIALTSRNKNSENPIPMAGVPYHSVQQYIDVLIESGYKVAIAEQVEDPKKAVGVVKREVVQVITPGTVVDSSKPDSQNNFLVALDKLENLYGLAYMDLVTGEFQVTSLSDFNMVCGEIRNLRAREVVLGYELPESEHQVLANQMNLLLSQVGTAFEDVQLLGDELSRLEHQVAGKLLEYVHQTQLRELSHLKRVHHYEIKDFLQMDYATMASLDLTENARTGKKHGSLYWLMDETKTAMGTRLLRRWIQQPLIDKERILKRQDVVQVFLDHFFERSDLADSLKGVYDIERLASRVSFGKTNPKDLLQLAATLSNVPQIKGILQGIDHPVLGQLIENLDDIPELANLIQSAISPDAPNVITEGNIIQTGFDETLDKYRVVMRDGTSWIADIEAKERAASGINNLKIDYNKKDGYYFHVTNSQLEHVPSHFFRKATLKNSERFGTEELARIEGEMLEAREKSANLEYEIFMRIREEAGKYIKRLQSLAQTLATIDVLQSFAAVAEKQRFVRPEFIERPSIEIDKGRHAVVEKVMGAQTYIPNSISMDENVNVQLITGPNMSGKSTYMRQLAIIVIMAQMGSYVSAESAQLPIFDAIFTRIGAADDLVSGQSTFMVEMMEANHAISQATEHSLILFDELGRGTATYDGMALAQAIIEYIHNRTGAKTLFATHYHELTDLSTSLTQLENVHVATLEKDGQVTFLHKIEAGPADKSYGIHVAKIAGLPNDLLMRADQILTRLEEQANEKPSLNPSNKGANDSKENQVSEQISLFTETTESPVLEKLRQLDIYNMTPMEVMLAVAEMKKHL